MPYFHLFPFVFSKKCGEGRISRVDIFFSVQSFFVILIYTYSLFSGSRLSIINHFFFCCIALLPITLILITLLNFLYSCSLRLESQKVYIDSVLTHCIKIFLLAMRINEMGCVAEAKFVFHCI